MRPGTRRRLRVMAFDSAALSDKLKKLNASAQSVEQLSAWCVFHYRHAKEICTTWAASLSAAPDGQKLAFVFLANDVVQNSRKKGPHYVDAFAPVLPGALKHVAKHATGGAAESKTLAQLRRLVSVWEERRVFGVGKTITALKAAVGLDGVAGGSGAPGHAGHEAATSAAAAAGAVLVAAQEALAAGPTNSGANARSSAATSSWLLQHAPRR